MVGALQEVVPRFKYHQNWSDQALSELCGQKFALSHWFGHWLIQTRNLAAN